MLKRILTTTVVITFFSTTVPEIAAAQEQVQAGVSAAVRGDVQVARADAVGRQVNSGEAIFLEDGIVSGPDSGMQVLLLDETVFTIGPESEISIDEFVYDPALGEGSLVASMAKGTMRFVTGNIASGTPENMSIKLPVGTIGIRGTTGIAVVLTQQQAQQQFPNQAPQGSGPGAPVVFAALTGPGPLANAGSGTGSFNFSTPNGDIDLNRPGAAVLATPGQPPVFFIAPPGAIQSVATGLRGGTGGVDDDTQDDSAQSQDNQDSDQGGDDAAATDGSESGTSDSADTGGENGGSTDGGLGGEGGSSTVSNSGVGNDTSFNQVVALETDTQTTNNSSDIVSDVANSTGNTTTFSDIADNFGNSGTASGSGSISGAITGSFNTFIDFSARTVDVQTGTLSQGGSTIGTVILNSGSGVSVADGSTGFSIGSGNNTGTCSSCTGSVAFTSPNSMSLSVEHAGGSGSGSATYN